MSKKIFIILFCTLLISLLASCVTQNAKSVTATKENLGYVQFVTSTGKETVTVSFDNEMVIDAETCSSTIALKNKNTYALTTGAHTISVSFNGNIVLNKKVFISPQEINVVELPL